MSATVRPGMFPLGSCRRARIQITRQSNRERIFVLHSEPNNLHVTVTFE